MAIHKPLSDGGDQLGSGNGKKDAVVRVAPFPKADPEVEPLAPVVGPGAKLGYEMVEERHRDVEVVVFGDAGGIPGVFLDQEFELLYRLSIAGR